MKKFLVLTMSALIIAGCGGNSSEVLEQDAQTDTLGVADCVIGEVYSLSELSFDLCAFEEVTVSFVDNNLTPIMYNLSVLASVVEGDYTSNRLIVDADELRQSLEGGFFTGIESNSEDTLSLNYVDISGFNTLEVKYDGGFNGFSDYFVLVGDDILTFDNNFNAVAVLSGVILR